MKKNVLLLTAILVMALSSLAAADVVVFSESFNSGLGEWTVNDFNTDT